MWALERTGAVFAGRYHVLGGALSALNGVGPEELNIVRPDLARGCRPRDTELILALNATVDGQTTAHYIAECARRDRPPALWPAPPPGAGGGGELDYLDEGTLMAALKARRQV